MKRAILVVLLGSVAVSGQSQRPQTPQPPFPYRSQEIRLQSNAPAVWLACTLTIPETEGKHPGLLLVSGSGPQDRDESVLGHKPFLVLSDYLTRHGVSVLRCDDRGVGKSSGRFLGATTTDFSLDAEGAFRYLLKRPEISRAGILGQSEGANIAAIVASRRRDVEFVVMMAGTGVTGEQVGYSQAAAIHRASGWPEPQIEEYRAMMAALVARTRAGAGEIELLRAARARFASIADAQRLARLLSDPWHRAAVLYNPAPILSKVTCPVLVLNGDLDLQVVADLNVPAIEAALRNGGNLRVTTKRFPGLNHLFQNAKTGLPEEYFKIEETIAPVILNTIATWIADIAK